MLCPFFSFGVTDNLIPTTVNISSILGEDEIQERVFSEPILEELVPRYTKVLLGGLKEEVKTDLIKKYLPPENFKVIVPPVINPEVKVAVQENTLKRDARLSNLQGQVAAVISILIKFTSKLAKESGEENIKHIETTNDALRLLCDVFYHESVSRRELLLLNLNKDLKETLKNTTISEYLFGKELETTIEAAKKLEKSGEQLKIKKYKPSFSTMATTSKQGNFRRPFAKGVQQMESSYQQQRREETPSLNDSVESLSQQQQCLDVTQFLEWIYGQIKLDKNEKIMSMVRCSGMLIRLTRPVTNEEDPKKGVQAPIKADRAVT
ncbi:unnamed protein product [Acanthoscelides obtectus]|uniref:Uncharacterized protein n=1 Tax=Acanthoscelides obtectus TaxID=200917 RepID=A0A9P0LZG6_ACAOB|nr:unnamed protein product [Acanthoscelides obtectus]CAK1645181.1 hypothetical protein AOBTE_LOCUS14049 [Acanthoscelides obtectus]